MSDTLQKVLEMFTYLRTSTVTSVTRLAASIIPEAESTSPPVGLATSPTTPFPTPMNVLRLF